jgi:hypothetical protein
MDCKTNNPAARQFTYRFGAAMPLYTILSVLATVGLLLCHPNGITIWLFAILPALPIIAAVSLTGLYMHEEKDEFQRFVLVQALLGGIGAILTVTTVWGFLENYAQFRHLNILFIWPLYCVFVGISYGLVKARYR